MQRSIRRNIVKTRAKTNNHGLTAAWARYQQDVYGDNYDVARRSGMRTHFHLHAIHTFKPMNQRAISPTAPVGIRVAALNAFANFVAKITRKPALNAFANFVAKITRKPARREAAV